MEDHKAETSLDFYREHDVRSRDLGFALHVAEELTPLPARSRSALLILRDALSNLTGIPIPSLLDEFQPVETVVSTATELPKEPTT